MQRHGSRRNEVAALWVSTVLYAGYPEEMSSIATSSPNVN